VEEKNLISKYKKGNAIIDSIMWLVIILVFAILSIVTYKVIVDVDEDIQADDDMGTRAKTASTTIKTNYPKIMDAGFVLVVVLMWILIIVASFNIAAHPIFFAVTLFLMTFVLFVGASFTNVFQDFIADGDLGSTSDDFPKTTWIMSHLLHLIIVVAMSIIIVLYGKNKYSEGV
jgi:4-hydroxybenzoate polyprenyltransferase